MSKYRFIIVLLSGILLFLVPMTRGDSASEISMVFRDSLENPITTPLDLRFSLWNVFNSLEGDIGAEGNLNTASPRYGGYQTTLSIAPDVNGYFIPATFGFYRLNPRVDLPDFPAVNVLNAYIQVEYKSHGAPNTEYIIYDFVDDPPFSNIQRLLLDEYGAYYATDAGPQTNWNTFTLDDNNNASANIKLQFGDALNEFLQWSKTNVRFELSGNLYVDGSVTLNGDLDFSLNEMRSVRLENLASAPVCDAASKGRIYYNTGDNLPYYCNGASWGPL